MKVKNFAGFVRSKRLDEQSMSDFSQYDWTERGQDSQPPNSGFEGTSSEPMDYSAGYYGEENDEDIVDINDSKERPDTKD
jgi:hypothetical protein